MANIDTATVVAKKRVATPTVIQMEAVECGAASLAMVLEYYGRIVPLEELRLACGVTRDGSKASNILRAARTYGLEAKGFKKEPANLGDLDVPMILHWNFNHFLVFEGLRWGKCYLNDPATGPTIMSKERFDQSFTGVAITFKPGPDFKRVGDKRTIFRSLKPRFTGMKLPLIFVILAGLLLVLPGLITPIFSKIFVDNILVQRMDSWFMPLLLGMGLTVFVKAVLTWLREFFLLKLQLKLGIRDSGKYFTHLLKLPVEFFAQRMAGDISKRVKINDRVATLLTGNLATAILDSVTIIFYAALMFYYDVFLTLIGIFIASLNLVILKVVARAREDENSKLMMDAGKLHGTSMSGLKLIETLKAGGSESDFFMSWSGYHAKVLNGKQNLGRITYWLMSSPPFLSQISTVAILGIGGLRVMEGDLSMGMLVAFQSLMSSFITPFNNLVNFGADLQKVKSDMERLDDVLRYKQDPFIKDEENLENAPTTLSGHLEIRDLAFGFSRLEKPLIDNFNLTLKPGARVALVGKSGSGKSTVAKIVGGLYQPWSGEILFDGKPRSAYPRSTIVNSLAMVDQDIFLFEGSVRDNLTMWDQSVTDHQVVEAARDALIHDDIAARPGTYNSRVQEGGGQLQRRPAATYGNRTGSGA